MRRINGRISPLQMAKQMDTQAILEMIVSNAALEERIVCGSQPGKRAEMPPPLPAFATPALQAERLALYRYLHSLTCI